MSKADVFARTSASTISFSELFECYEHEIFMDDDRTFAVRKPDPSQTNATVGDSTTVRLLNTCRSSFINLFSNQVCARRPAARWFPTEPAICRFLGDQLNVEASTSSVPEDGVFGIGQFEWRSPDTSALVAVKSFLSALYALEAKGLSRHAVGSLVDFVDDLLLDGHFAACNSLMMSVNVKRLSLESIVAILAISYGARERLSKRMVFFLRASHHAASMADAETTVNLLKKYH